MDDLDRNEGSDSESLDDERLDVRVKETQIKATTPSTMRTYTSMMKEIQKTFPDRKIFYNPTSIAEPIDPISGDELLRFLGRKRLKKPSLTMGYLSQYKSAVVKFRELNKHPPFSVEENRHISQFLRGVRQERSVADREGRLSSEEGKRRLRFQEYVTLCQSIVSAIPNGIQRKFVSELHFFYYY